MKKSQRKIHTSNPINVASFTPPALAGVTGLNEADKITTKTTTTTTNTNSGGGIAWINAISSALGSLMDKFSPIAGSIWGGDKSADIVDENKSMTNYLIIGGVVIVAIILIAYLFKK